MFVREHLQAQSYRHMIGLDDVARRLHASLGAMMDDDVTAHIILPYGRAQPSAHTYSNALAREPRFVCS
jgi:hypothetical protein